MNPQNLYSLSKLRPIFLPLPPDATSSDYWDLDDLRPIKRGRQKHYFDNFGYNGIHDNNKDSLVSCPRNNNNSDTRVGKLSNQLSKTQTEQEAQNQTSSAKNNDFYFISKKNYFKSQKDSPPRHFDSQIQQHKNNIVAYNRPTNYKKVFRSLIDEAAASENSIKKTSSSDSGEQELINLQNIYVKTAGANLNISATANNHRKNLKLRHQNMDHDYRYLYNITHCHLPTFHYQKFSECRRS